MNVKQYLKQHRVAFDVLRHPRTETAMGTVDMLKVPEQNFAKTVVLKADGRPVIAVVQAPFQVDPVEVKNCLGAGVVELADEAELESYFSDCETGAIPPFGSHYGMPTVVDTHLAEDEYIVFNGNTHDEAIAMRYRDFEMIEHPHEAEIRELAET
jgi:Ala-tRNA(Pro) deacylase